MKLCILCSELTEGSVGAAGIKWNNICQPCKDKEDDIALRRVRAQKQFLDLFAETISGMIKESK